MYKGYSMELSYVNNLQKINNQSLSRDEYRARRNAKARYIRLKKRKRNICVGAIIILLFSTINILNSNNPTIISQGISSDVNTQINVKTTAIYGLSESMNPVDKPIMSIDHIPINPISRPGYLVESVDYIVIHYIGNPGTTAQQNRSYYEEVMATMEASVSSNYLVGLEGEIIECIPSYEVAYASNHMNSYSISIEGSHPGEDGEFTSSTYQSMVELSAWLCGKYQLTADALLRHYDVTGKECPKSFVDKPEQWEKFKADVKVILENN